MVSAFSGVVWMGIQDDAGRPNTTEAVSNASSAPRDVNNRVRAEASSRRTAKHTVATA
jgi:hypothetical protein